jgi:hypothetical protein
MSLFTGSLAGSRSSLETLSQEIVAGGLVGSSEELPLRSPSLSSFSSTSSSYSLGLDDTTLLSAHERCESEFTPGVRVFHAVFGQGLVSLNDGTFLTISFDDPKYGSMKLKAFYAVPKMVALP